MPALSPPAAQRGPLQQLGPATEQSIQACQRSEPSGSVSPLSAPAGTKQPASWPVQAPVPEGSPGRFYPSRGSCCSNSGEQCLEEVRELGLSQELRQESPFLTSLTPLECPCRSQACEWRSFRRSCLALAAPQTRGRPFLKSQEDLDRPAQHQNSPTAPPTLGFALLLAMR